MIDRNAFDPIDGLQQLRRILAHIATAPHDLILKKIIAHVTAKDSLRMFDAEMISLFIIRPERPNIMQKYTVRSTEPTLCDFELTSLAAETIRSSRIARINSIAQCNVYHPDVDGCPGVVVKRILSLPIFNSMHDVAVGCVHIINKGHGNQIFAEVDEVFGLIYADQVSLLVSSCIAHEKLKDRSHLVESLLESSTAIFAAIPESDTVAYISKSLLPAEILTTLENTSRDLLQCAASRAYLISDYIDMESGQLVMLDKKYSPHIVANSNISVRLAPVHSGIAGHVISTKTLYQIEDASYDPYINPTVDLDPLLSAMVTVPIVDLYGTVVGCIQLVAGTNSPAIRPSPNVDDSWILFAEAAQWYAHQIATPLQYLINSIGRPANRPLSTPSNLAMAGFDASKSFLELPDGIAQQIMRSKSKASRDFDSVPFNTIMFEQTNSNRSFRSPTSSRGGKRGKPSVDTGVNTDDLPVVEKVDCESMTDPVEKKETATVMTPKAEPLQVPKKDFDDLTVQLADSKKSHEETRKMFSDLGLAYKANLGMTKETDQKLKALENEKRDISKLLEEERKKLNEALFNLAAATEAAQSVPTESVKQPVVSEKVSEKASIVDQSTEVESLNHKVLELTNELRVIKDAHEVDRMELSDLKGDLDMIKAEKDIAENGFEKACSEKNNLKSENQKLLAEIEKLKETIVQRDAVQAILQNQLVKMANDNVKDIDSAMSKSKQKPKEISRPASASDDPPGVTSRQRSNSTIKTSRTPSLRDIVTSKPPETLPPSNRPSSARYSSRLIGIADSSLTSEKAPYSNSEDWIEQVDEHGQTYYYNSLTGETSWTKPNQDGATLLSGGDGVVMVGDWAQQFDENGQEYWVNQITGESAWEIPNDDNLSLNSNDSLQRATAGNYTIDL